MPKQLKSSGKQRSQETGRETRMVFADERDEFLRNPTKRELAEESAAQEWLAIQKLLDESLLFEPKVTEISALEAILMQDDPKNIEAAISTIETEVKAILNNSEKFSNKFESSSDLIALSDFLKNCARKMIRLATANKSDKEIDRLAKRDNELRGLSASLISPVLQESKHFNRLIGTSFELTRMMYKYPLHSEALTKPLLENPETFDRIITLADRLIGIILANIEPAKALAEYALKNHEKHESLTISNDILEFIKRIYPELAEKESVAFCEDNQKQERLAKHTGALGLFATPDKKSDDSQTVSSSSPGASNSTSRR